MSKDKSRIAARIRALREKTVENGCTEEGAAAAAEMVAKMLEKYNLSLDECDLRENQFKRHTEVFDDPVGERLWKIGDGIAHLLNVRYWTSSVGSAPSVSFFGFEHEVEIATYLLDICRNAMSTHMKSLEREFRLLRPAVQRRRIAPYLDGMADRLRQRLREMKPVQPPGKGLVVLRNDLIDAAMADEGINLQDRSTRASRNFEPEYQRGRDAADSVALNRGIKSGQPVAGLIE